MITPFVNNNIIRVLYNYMEHTLPLLQVTLVLTILTVQAILLMENACVVRASEDIDRNQRKCVTSSDQLVNALVALHIQESRCSIRIFGNIRRFSERLNRSSTITEPY